MALISLLFYLPMNIIMAITPQYLYDSQSKLNEIMLQLPSGNFMEVLEYMDTVDPILLDNTFILTALNFGIAAFFTPLAIGAATYITKQALQGKKIDRSEMLAASIGRIWKYLFTTLALCAILSISFLLIIPCIFFSVTFYFSQNAVADEGKWGIGAFKKSSGIVSGRWFKTLFFILAILILEYMVNYVFALAYVLLAIDSAVLAMVFNILIRFFCLWFTVATCVMYFNLSSVKSRRQGESN